MGRGDYVDDWVDEMRRRRLAIGTIKNRRRALRRVQDSMDPLTATSRDLVDWLDNDCDLGVRAWGVYASMLRAFYGWARREGLVDESPMSDVEVPRAPRTLPRPIDSDDLWRAVEAADGMVRCWLLLAALDGLRCIEISRLDRQHVNTGDRTLLLTGKGGHERIVPVAGTAWAALVNCGLPDSGPLWIRPRKGGRYPAGQVSAIGNRHLHEQGITSTMHQLRHWFGTETYRETRDIRFVQELMGHQNPQTTAIYAAADMTRAEEVIGRLAQRRAA